MTDRTDLVSRVDTLVRRRRSFVANPAKSPTEPTEPTEFSAPGVSGEGEDKTADSDGANAAAPCGDDDDLPVLTEIIPSEAAIFEERGDRFDETQVALLASDITHAIGLQLSSDLPSLIESALVNAAEELHAGISASMESALRDFIARRKQLRLPLDEPEGND